MEKPVLSMHLHAWLNFKRSRTILSLRLVSWQMASSLQELEETPPTMQTCNIRKDVGREPWQQNRNETSIHVCDDDAC